MVKLLTLSLLAYTNALAPYTTPMPFTTSNPDSETTTGCARCIRSGYVYCSLKTNWYTHGATPAVGKCCEMEAGCKETDMVCSTDFASNDIALGACPQDDTKCGLDATNFYEFKTKSPADSPTAISASQTIDESKRLELTLTGLTQDDKCTFIVKAVCGAPGFDLSGMSAGGTKLQLHYVEYDAQMTTMDATNTNYPDMATANPLAYENQQQMKGNTLGYVKQYINPNEYQDTQKRVRYVGGDQVLNSIQREKDDYIQPYEDLVTAYNVKANAYKDDLKTYNDKIKAGEPVGTFNIIKPTRPTDPDEYQGLYMEMEPIALPYPAQSVDPAPERGGWGALTSGMLLLTGEKSYGVFGQGVSNTGGITKDFRSMKDATCTGEKYMMVTVLPTYQTTYTQAADVKLILGSYAWGDYFTEFKKPKVIDTRITL